MVIVNNDILTLASKSKRNQMVLIIETSFQHVSKKGNVILPSSNPFGHFIAKEILFNAERNIKLTLSLNH